jgi:hypothetical protein
VAVNVAIRRQLWVNWRAGCSCDPVILVNGTPVLFNFETGTVVPAQRRADGAPERR